MAPITDHFQLIKAFGSRDYLITDPNYQKKILHHPIISGLWTSGDFFLFVGNTQNWKAELVTGNTLEISGYSTEEMHRLGPEFWMRFSHPQHIQFNLLVVKRAMAYIMSRKEEERDQIYVVYFYKGIRKDGSGIIVQQQSIPILFDERKIPFVFANIVTDISFLGQMDTPQSTLINRYTNDIFHLNPQESEFSKLQEKFTKRELEVIHYLKRGRNSREIAQLLFISYETVRTHRRNILQKARVKNISQFIAYAHRYAL